MDTLKQLFENNEKWAEDIEKQFPGFFKELSTQQTPEYLWIGCADSRVPANEIVGLAPGELFVHRNVANLVLHTDMNCMSVLQYAVEVLKVKHIIVCGHYGCGGVHTAMTNNQLGLINTWLLNIKNTYKSHYDELQLIEDTTERGDKLCELNVIAQVNSIAQTSIVQNAWKSNANLDIHGWIYSIENGLLNNLDVSINKKDQVDPVYQLD